MSRFISGEAEGEQQLPGGSGFIDAACLGGKAATRRAVLQQGCSFGESLSGTLRITELLFKGSPCLQIPCPLSRVFNLIVLLGIIPWITGHTVAGMFALQVRKMMRGCWGGFSIWDKPRDFICVQGEGKQKSEQF